MLILGYGIGLDVEDLRFAVLDRDHAARAATISKHRRVALFHRATGAGRCYQLDRRMRSDGVSVAIEIPTHFAVDLKRGRG
jgi:ribosome-dependent ATPase